MINIAVAIHKGEIKDPDYDYRDYDAASNWTPFKAWYNVLRKERKWKPTGLGLADAHSDSSGSGRGDIVGEQGTGSTEGVNEQEKMSMPSRKRGGHLGRGKAKQKKSKEYHKSEKTKKADEIAASINASNDIRARAAKIAELKTLTKLTETDKDDGMYNRAKAALKKLLSESIDQETVASIGITPSHQNSSTSDLSESDSEVINMCAA
jgi:hypothetical protein